MEAANADSDHSMTWEDFFGSTTDLAPTLLGIYDSLLDPKSLRPEVNRLETAKDARNDPPVPENSPEMTEETKDRTNEMSPKDPSKITGSVKLPIASVNKSSLYSFRTKSDNKNGASDETDRSEVTTSDTYPNPKLQRTFKETKPDAFDHLSPNVKRMISSATETTTLKFQKKTITGARSSIRHRTNIPLVGATSKISQSGVEILPSMEIYDQPCGFKGSKSSQESPPRQLPVKTHKQNVEYDVPTNNRPAIYDVPVVNQSKFESLSLPYIDQSIELSNSSNDREFDIKLSSKENSPVELKRATPEASPAKIAKTERSNSLHRNDSPRDETKLKQLLKSGPFPNAIGSTDNLKNYQDKELPRLNPPTVEVSRPLSMSSIASSSSTSSSGVQNKGGVNSAYLASIESLDDHSDADVTSANGSNNFVNSAGLLNTSISEEGRSENTSHQNTSDEMSGLSQLERVCAEIVQTENVYVEDLRQVVEGYLHVWRRETTFSDDELTDLFNNIEDIYNFNRTLCEELSTCHLDATCMARSFADNTSGFSVYTSYCTGYPRTMERLAALASEPKSAREFRERQIALGHALPLASYLLKPVQRILKYHLLLQNVVKQCACYETEYAFRKMTDIAQHIDDMKRRHEHAVRVQEIQSLLYGWNGPDLTTYGELCAEGTFRVFGAKAMRHVFLFDKMLLITKNREDGILAYKSHIMCNNMMLVESISGAPLSFHVIPWDAPRSQLTLQARSARHKREWTLLLKRVILENYNAVIPSHARQLVMELGQNKTDDDILAEKSHGLITQASMRKQLSAPEYLEKRKLDRDRRKTFENGIRGRLKKVNRKPLAPNSRVETQCDCAQVSAEKGADYTCDNCYVDLCSDCETEINKLKTGDKYKCTCNDANDKCPECDRSLHYIDSGSVEHLERKQSCKCSDFTSEESFDNPLNKTRGYHSSDDIVSLNSNNEAVDAKSNVLNKKTCLKCAKINENIPVTDTNTLHIRKSRLSGDKHKAETLRSKSKDDPQRSRLSKIGTWRRKSEPGLQQNMPPNLLKKYQDSDSERNDGRGNEKIEFECRNCGSNKINRKVKCNDGVILSDPEIDIKTSTKDVKQGVEVKMYNTKNVPKKISKLKKNRAKGIRLGSDTTAKFYADFSTDVSTENILHISESTDSLHVDKSINNSQTSTIPESISKDDDIDEETYKKLIEKTDSFKKNELEKVKFLNKHKVINEGSEVEDNKSEVDIRHDDVPESCEEEQPLEQIISQLLMQNREFQKLLKKQQQSNSAKRRHQRLLKSHSNPEQTISIKNGETNKLKPKYGRQTSEHLEEGKNDQKEVKASTTLNDIEDISEDDHIYETLRVENRVHETLHNIDIKSKVIQHNVSRPKRLPSPPSQAQHIHESDYVYLSFDKLNNLQDEEGIYDVPIKPPEALDQKKDADYYVVVEKKDIKAEEDKNVYDNLVEVTRRKKEAPDSVTNDYLPMNANQLSPNTPEIWLSRQKEHFNVSRDRKSGSLPRSFQVVIDGTEENNLSSFKFKPNSNSKTYLNRDGKVMSIDRPFTIASDQSELSYDDVENYMSDGDILKFHNKSTPKESDGMQKISQSTLELEEEIDRCYKNNFENLDANKNENLLTVSQPNLNTSMTSSCEVLSVRNEAKIKDEVIHPEHKIYKPTSNMLSLKNVLNRFKNRGHSKSQEEAEINANDQSSPDNVKQDLKSPTNEKRSALNPRSYSKNLLQRFRSIIGDEHSDNNQNKTETVTHFKTDDSSNANKNEIKVVITSTDVSPTTSTIVYTVNDPLSRSVFEQTTITDSQNEKANLEALSHSCDNITDKSNEHRPSFEKSVSMISSISSNTSSLYSKSNTTSYQSLNKLPVYMQGSKHLGARIAQSEYVDPSTLKMEKSVPNHANILINKNSVRPDSLFSNSSFVTSSSEGTYQERPGLAADDKQICDIQSDDSYYEKTFEKIESITDDVFRDSAVYSDQDDGDESKSKTKDKQAKTLSRVESLKRNASFIAQKVTVTSSMSERTSTTRTIGITKVSAPHNTKNQAKELDSNVKPKAPPVPIKPKISNIPSTSFRSKTIIDQSNVLKTNETLFDSNNAKTIKRNSSYKQTLVKTESSLTDVKTKVPVLVKHENYEKTENTVKEVSGKPQGNIQLKRMSFERASLDSATRKLKVPKENRSSAEPPKVTAKSVLERRMEIEMKSQISKPESSIKKPVQIAKPKSITTKVASFERSVSEIDRKETKGNENVIPVNVNSINEDKNDTDDPKSSWVKQVVNKFQ